MSDQRSNEMAWRRIRILQALFRILTPASWLFFIFAIASFGGNRLFRTPIGTILTTAHVAAGLVAMLGFYADRKLMRAACPDCGERLFARLPPKHIGEEYLDHSSPSCANCGVMISPHAP